MNTFQYAVLAFSLFAAALSPTKANTITAPVLADFNQEGVTFCQKQSIRIRFDHQGAFLFNNVFTAEVAANGDFTGQIFTMTGSVAQAGSAVNVFFTATFPTGLQPGVDYKIRIKSSSPVVFSLPNQFSFRINIVAPMKEDFPTGYWRGNFYTWTPTTPEVILDGNTQDIFNPNNYAGYITEDTLAFDFNWGINGPAPGLLADSNKVCGQFTDFYSIRMRRKINFEAGYYIIGGGGDDGFRLSLDGGNTWLIDFWYDHEFTGRMENNGCGVFLEAGERDVVAEYYENKTHSRFRVIIKKTGDPAIAPISITSPTVGDVVCVNAAPYFFSANPPGAFQWSGPGMSASGQFNPQAAGLGFKTINYETGFAAFGANCVKSTSVTIRVVDGLTSNFTGLDTAYCQGAAAVKLVPEISGGSFTGAPVEDNFLKLNELSPGNYTIGYALDPSTGCAGDTVRKSFVLRPTPNASFGKLPDSVFSNAPNIQLIPELPGGIFTGEGVVTSNAQWIPSILPSGIYTISYSVTRNGCTGVSEQLVRILDFTAPVIIKPEYKIPSLITANNDGANDKFIVKGMADGTAVHIYNRWGKMIHKGNVENEVAWGASADHTSGLYYYHLKLETGEQFSGWLKVVK